MGMEDFWEQLPTGKEDKPLLFEMGPLEYDFHDIDGLYFMLDRRLSGCINQYMEVMGNMWVLGIPLRGLVTEYGREYQLHVEGFVDMDGNEMNPQDFTVRGVEKVKPKPEDATHEQIALEAAKASGSFSAQLASGAMSASHVSASMSASGSVSGSTSDSKSYSESHNYSY